VKWKILLLKTQIGVRGINCKHQLVTGFIKSAAVGRILWETIEIRFFTASQQEQVDGND
jgi:hypothetical protein